ncbi:MAG TPA: DUF6691 family protein [bacterium]
MKKQPRKTNRLSKKIKTSSKGGVMPYLFFGILFGYFLSKSRASDYDTIVDMFWLKDFHLYGVIGTAIAVTALGLFLLRKNKKQTISGKAWDWKTSAIEPERLTGALLFGIGWALTGACPGTALVQVGEGKLMAFVTVAGIMAGIWIYKKNSPRLASKDPVC